MIMTRLKFCFSESVFALPLHLVDNLAGVAQMVKESVCNVGDLGLIPGLRRHPWGRAWPPMPVFLPGESQDREPGGL